MLRNRVVKTASGANAGQVVYYKNDKRFIFSILVLRVVVMNWNH